MNTNIHDANAVLSQLLDDETIEVSIYDDGHIEGSFNLRGKTAEIEARRIVYLRKTLLTIKIKYAEAQA